MTEQIFESDLELAKRLLAQDREDSEIIAALVRRRIQPTAAAQLVADLRKGKPVTPLAPLSSSRSIPTPAAAPDAAAPRPSPAKGSSTRRSERRHRSTHLSRSRTTRAVLWTVAVLLLILGIVAAAVTWSRHRSDSTPAKVAGATSPSPAAETSAVDRQALSADGSGVNSEQPTPARPDSIAINPAQKLSSHGLLVELQPAGLRIAGHSVTSQNALSMFVQILGDPTRTNHLQQSDKFIYAFDKHGLLVYARAGSGGDHVVLDFEALGGTNGTAAPFLGTFILEQTTVNANTEYKTLASLKSLSLDNPVADSGILGGQYHQLRLYFAYLKTPEHLSMVEIDLQ